MSTPHDPSAAQPGDWSTSPSSPEQPKARPGPVVGAVLAWIGAGLLLILMGIANVTAAGDEETQALFTERFADSEVQVSASMIEQVLIVTGFAGMVIGLFVIAFGSLLLNGTNWVRIAVIVAGLPGTVFVWPALFMVLGTVLQFLPSSNAWFRTGVPTSGGPAH